jgi:4-hydroxy-tetrahydrodipicolinate reductase
MTRITIIGDGGLGRASEAAFRARGDDVASVGRPTGGRHDPGRFAGVDLVVEASHGDAVAANVTAALDGGCRRLVIATTGWSADEARVATLLHERGAAAVAAPNFSLGVVLFGRLVDAAVELFGPLSAYDPYLVEWHRRTKHDRPSGTAAELARRIVAGHPGKSTIGPRDVDGPPGPDALEVVSVRAGASPGMHLVGFDAPGETVELRLTARDRSAYAAGILAASDWLERTPRAPGLHPFEPIVDELVGRAFVAA